MLLIQQLITAANIAVAKSINIQHRTICRNNIMLHVSADIHQRAEHNQPMDHVRNYARAVTWYGLLDLCHRDTIREADGPAMMSMWRLNMLRFWGGNHFKYLQAGHRLLAGIGGWWTPYVAEEVLHNRTVNLTGGLGHNVAMDRACEFLNAEFKGQTLQLQCCY